MKQRAPKPTASLCAVAALCFCLCIAACGGSGPATTGSSQASSLAAASATLPQPELKEDGELDSDSYPGTPDNDNNHVFGHAAGAAEARAVSAVVERYYAAAARGDGALACSLMYSTFAEAIAEDYGGAPGGSTNGGGCAAAASSLFKRRHTELGADSATLRMAAVRIRHREGSALMSFHGGRPRYYLSLHLERGAWKVLRLIASEQAIYVE
jgi:hypothetical protein